MAKKILIDCDPGVDDAVMLFLAFAARKELEIVGITTVGGNVPLKLTTRNARLIREMAGREDVPVIAGCPRPLVRPPIGAGEFHGASGVGALEVFEPKAAAVKGHGVNFLIDTLAKASKASITLVITGPFTNVAAALVMQPTTIRAIDEIVVMGGARTEGGNITASAEYNIYADPHAAQVVAMCGAKVVWLGLDATHQVRATKERIEAIRKLKTKSAAGTAKLLDFAYSIEPTYNGTPGAPLHDPCTIAYVLEPDLFDLTPAHVRVETGSELTLGSTQVEFRQKPKMQLNARWVTKVDHKGVFDLITEMAAR